eukprot:5218717-Prymnesium_polylepis.1
MNRTAKKSVFLAALAQQDAVSRGAEVSQREGVDAHRVQPGSAATHAHERRGTLRGKAYEAMRTFQTFVYAHGLRTNVMLLTRCASRVCSPRVCGGSFSACPSIDLCSSTDRHRPQSQRAGRPRRPAAAVGAPPLPPLRAGRQAPPSPRGVARRRPPRLVGARGPGRPPLHPPRRPTDERIVPPCVCGGCHRPPHCTS